MKDLFLNHKQIKALNLLTNWQLIRLVFIDLL